MLDILAPIFGLIALAYAARKVDILGPAAYVELNRYVASLALPALLFDNVAHVTPAQLNQPAFIASFAIGALVVFAVPLFFSRADALSATACWTGLPRAIRTSGTSACRSRSSPSGRRARRARPSRRCSPPACCSASRIALLEWDLHRGHAFGVAMLKVGGSLARNPILLAPIVGADGDGRMDRDTGRGGPRGQAARRLRGSVRARGARPLSRAR